MDGKITVSSTESKTLWNLLDDETKTRFKEIIGNKEPDNFTILFFNESNNNIWAKNKGIAKIGYCINLPPRLGSGMSARCLYDVSLIAESSDTELRIDLI